MSRASRVITDVRRAAASSERGPWCDREPPGPAGNRAVSATTHAPVPGSAALGGQGQGWRGMASRPWLPACLALGVALWRIGTPSFSGDEAASLSAARRSAPQLWHMLGSTDAVHGAYYVLLWMVARLAGTGEFAARLPSALAVAGAAAGITAIGWRLASRRAGLTAGTAFAVFPVASKYAQDARSYAFVIALAVLASYLFVRAGQAPARRRWLAAYALALTALGWANLMALLIIPAHAVTLAGIRVRARRISASGLRQAAVTAAPQEDPALCVDGWPAVMRWLAAAGAAVGEQDQGRDDLHSFHGQWERVSVPAGVAVGGGELAHVAVGDGAGDPGQPGHGGRSSAADPPVSPQRRRHGPGHFAALEVRGLVKRTASGSPSMRMRFAWRLVRCCGRGRPSSPGSASASAGTRCRPG